MVQENKLPARAVWLVRLRWPVVAAMLCNVYLVGRVPLAELVAGTTAMETVNQIVAERPVVALPPAKVAATREKSKEPKADRPPVGEVAAGVESADPAPELPDAIDGPSPLEEKEAAWTAHLDPMWQSLGRLPRVSESLADELQQLGVQVAAIELAASQVPEPTVVPADKPSEPDTSIDSQVAAVPAEEVSEAAIQPATAPRLRLANPRDSGGMVYYMLNDEIYSLYPGQTHDLTAEQRPTIRFDRGADFGTASFALERGTYRFVVSEKGWDLQPGAAGEAR